jgi:hypothetical protein
MWAVAAPKTLLAAGAVRADDCQRIFGAARVSKYVAQDNVEPLGGRRVTHRAIAHYFDAYSPDLARCAAPAAALWMTLCSAAYIMRAHVLHGLL